MATISQINVASTAYDINAFSSTVQDTRAAALTVTDLSKRAKFFFTNTGVPTTNWWSGIHINGWTGDYNAWEIVGPAHNADQRTTSLYVRSGRTTNGWGNWRRIYDSAGITYGTAEPSGGSNGDIYLQYID